MVRRQSGAGGEYLAAMALAAWLFYRNVGNVARGAAVFVGSNLFAPLVVVIGSVEPGESRNSLVVFVILYAMCAYLLYAIVASRERLVSSGRPPALT